MEAIMQKNITLSADASLIERSRKRASSRHTTLNAEFRRWLEQYVAEDIDEYSYELLMQSLHYCRSGRHFSRDELNER